MDDLLFENEELDFLTYCSNVEHEDDGYRSFSKLCSLSSSEEEGVICSPKHESTGDVIDDVIGDVIDFIPTGDVITSLPNTLESINSRPTDPLASLIPLTSDQDPCCSGTLERNLSSSIPDKSFTQKDKSLVKDLYQSSQQLTNPLSTRRPSEPLFLPRIRFLRTTSCSLNRFSADREVSSPTYSYSSKPRCLTDTTLHISDKEATEVVTVQNIHSEAGILDLDDALSDVVADKDVLVAEFEEETPYTPAPPPDIQLIFNQAAAGGEHAGSTAGSKPHNINDSSYFSSSSDMAWVDKWVQEADPNNSSPASRSSPAPPSRSSPIPARDLLQKVEGQAPSNGSRRSPHSSQHSSDRAIETTRHTIEQRVEIPQQSVERAIGKLDETRSRGAFSSERGVESKVAHTGERRVESKVACAGERGVESKVAHAGERGVESKVAHSDEGMERGVDVPSSLKEPASGGKEEEILKIEITKDNLPLGCGVRHVDCRSPGLYIMSIEEGSAAERDGRLQEGDKILDVNGVDLSAIPIVSVLDVYEEMTTTAHVRLTIQRQTPSIPLPPPGTAEKCPDNTDDSSIIQSKDTFELTLNKGQKGLGFTIATREYNTCRGYSPIFVKTVHRHGAAAADGRMKPNDVLLKVNGKSVVGMPQEAVVAMIRELTGVVSLTLQRATSDIPAPEKPKSPVIREPSPAPPPPPPAPPLQPATTRTRLSLEIPLVAPDGRPVGLGISVKGKSMSIRGETRRDYGIFIKTILKGGAADLDGRLRADDQLLTADGQSLHGLSNKEAMQVLKQTLERAGKLSSLTIVVSRKDALNLSADRRTAKPYSSFKDHNVAAVTSSSSLASDPNKYRALSMSSPNLGRKKKRHGEFEGSRGVAFSENIQSIPQAGDVLESDEDVVFVANLKEQLDPFNRDDIFRKSMKKIDQAPIHPNQLRRASSHDSLSRPNREQFTPIMKKGVSQESVFSGKDTDPVYDTITDDTIRPPRINDSLLNALQNGKIPTSAEEPTPASTTEEKPKSKTFLNFFSKKANKKKEDQKLGEPVRQNELARPKTRDMPAEFDPMLTSSPLDAMDSNRTAREFDTPSRSNVRDVEREQPRAPGSRGSTSDSANHKRSRSSDFYRDKELAERNGTGYIEHRVPHRDREYMSRGPSDRHSNRSNHSGRSRGERQPYNHYPPRDHPVRDPSRDHPVRDSPVRDHPARENSRDSHSQSRDSHSQSRDTHSQSRDRRYMETVQYRYGRSSPHHHPAPPPHLSPAPPPHLSPAPPPPPYYLDQHDTRPLYSDSRYSGSNSSLNKRSDARPQPQPMLAHQPPFQPMISHPVPHLQGRHNPEQLSDV